MVFAILVGPLVRGNSYRRAYVVMFPYGAGRSILSTLWRKPCHTKGMVTGTTKGRSGLRRGSFVLPFDNFVKKDTKFCVLRLWILLEHFLLTFFHGIYGSRAENYVSANQVHLIAVLSQTQTKVKDLMGARANF